MGDMPVVSCTTEASNCDRQEDICPCFDAQPDVRMDEHPCQAAETGSGFGVTLANAKNFVKESADDDEHAMVNQRETHRAGWSILR